MFCKVKVTQMGRRERGEDREGGSSFFLGFRSELWLCTSQWPIPALEFQKKTLGSVFCEMKDCSLPLNRHVKCCLTPTGLPCSVSQSGVYCSGLAWEFVFTARYICSVCAFLFSWGQLLMDVSDTWNVKLGVNFIIDFAFLLDTHNANNFLCQSQCSVFTQREATGQELGWTEVK